MSDEPEKNQSSNLEHNGLVPDNQTAATPISTKPKRTPEQQAVLNLVAAAKGREWAERHADRIIWETENF